MPQYPDRSKKDEEKPKPKSGYRRFREFFGMETVGGQLKSAAKAGETPSDPRPKRKAGRVSQMMINQLPEGSPRRKQWEQILKEREEREAKQKKGD